jgi:hypothetical protein
MRRTSIVMTLALCVMLTGAASGDTPALDSLQKSSNSFIITPGDNIVSQYIALGGTIDMPPASATNRRTLVLMPGVYTLKSTLKLRKDFVDIVGLGAPDDTVITGDIYATAPNTALILQTCDDIRIRNITFRNTHTGGGPNTVSHTFVIDAPNNAASEYENCNFKNATAWLYNCECVRGASSVYGTWKNCRADNAAWRVAVDRDFSPTMYDCTAGTYSFGGDQDGIGTGAGVIGGTFWRCEGGYASFGGCDQFGMSTSTAAKFYYCTAGNNSYAMGKTFAGYAFKCKGGLNSFGGHNSDKNTNVYPGTFAGRAEYCDTDGGMSFGMGTTACVQSGTMYRCKNGQAGSLSVQGGPSTLINAGAAATMTTALGGNRDLVFTAREKGINGNNITIEYYGPSGVAWAFIVKGSAIQCLFGTIDSTTRDANHLIAAMRANPIVSQLITVDLATGSDGTGRISTAMAATPLTGGVEPLGFFGNDDWPLNCAESTSIYAFDNGRTFTNFGATGPVTFTLPPAIPGLKYTIKKLAIAQNVFIVPAGTDTIDSGTKVANTFGRMSYITVECLTAGAWVTTTEPKAGIWVGS